ncbi:hypothetical protein [Duganella fentianensis]|uniref:hypothetical protein n=1 Tax=Duganella fentianensis TaxID=2692177 RepID=UPI0032B21EEE
MLIVAVAWIYVVGLMALTEPTVVAGIVTFLFYCVLPLSTLIYISGTGKRKARRRAEEQAAREAREAQQALAASVETEQAAAQDAARD